MGHEKVDENLYLDLGEAPCVEFPANLQKTPKFAKDTRETFSGPETLDLEHDRLGFLGIFSKIADFIEL